MPPLDLQVTFYGRPIKPVSLGLMLLCLILVGTNTTGIDSLFTPALRGIVAVFAATTAAVLFVAWFRMSQWLAEVGLLLVFALHLVRAIFIMLTAGWQDQNGWQSLAVCVIAAGSYFLERSDPKGTTPHRKGA